MFHTKTQRGAVAHQEAGDSMNLARVRYNMMKQAGIPVYPLPGTPEHNPSIPAPPVFKEPKRYTGLEGYGIIDHNYQSKYDAAKAEYDKAYADWDAKYGEAYRAPYNPPAPKGPSLPKVKMPSVNIPNPVTVGKNVLRGVGNAAVNNLIKRIMDIRLK